MGHNRYYQVIRASLNDTGVYTCVAENKIGSTKKDIEINILCMLFSSWNGTENKC